MSEAEGIYMLTLLMARNRHREANPLYTVNTVNTINTIIIYFSNLIKYYKFLVISKNSFNNKKLK